MYCKCGDMDMGRRVFYHSKERNAICWTALVWAYVANGRPEQAVRSVIWMQQEGFKLDLVTVATIFPVCAELKDLKRRKEIHAYAVKNCFLSNVSIICNGLKNLKLGKEIHGQILKKNFESIPFVTAEIVKMYGKCGAVDHAKSVFGAIPVKGSMTWTAIIEAYASNDMYRDAINLFDEMR